MDKEIKQQMHWAHLTLRTIKSVIHQIQVMHHIPSNPDCALSPEYWKSLAANQGLHLMMWFHCIMSQVQSSFSFCF
jgi:hypothetical protein